MTELPSTDWYRLPAEEVAARLGTEPASGLPDAEARRRLESHGPNVVTDRGGRSAWRALLAQFTGVLTLVLFAAAILSAFARGLPRRDRHPGHRRAQRHPRVRSGASGGTDPEDVKTAKNFVRLALDETLAGKPVSVASSQPYGCSVKY